MRARSDTQRRTILRTVLPAAAVGCAAVFAVACGGQAPETAAPAAQGSDIVVPESGTNVETPSVGTAYFATLTPVNPQLSPPDVAGKATFDVEGDTLHIMVHVDKAAPWVVHAQHLHGFVDGTAAQCPDSSNDDNGDGIVDDHEAEAVTGPPLIPLNADPVALDLAAETYPKADDSGTYDYDVKVSLSDLEKALGDSTGLTGLDLTSMVLMVHGALPDAALPADLGTGTDAHAPLPILCGRIEILPPQAGEGS